MALEHAIDELDERMSAYGWAEGDEARHLAQLRWMESVTRSLTTLLSRADATDELEAKLIEKGVL